MSISIQNRRTFLKNMGLATTCAATHFLRGSKCADAAAATRKPNIVFVYTDDQAAWTLGASGNSQARTPNLDRLASEGVRLTNAYVTTPVCSPARAALMVSRYASELGILDFIPQPGHKLYTEEMANVGLDPNLVTYPEMLAQAGYTNGLVGKWHVGDWVENTDDRFHPKNQGFHYFMGLTGGGTSPDNPPLEKDGKVQNFEGLTTDILTDHAIEFINKQKDNPFLLCLHYRAPHAKWLPVAPSDWEPYENMYPEIPNPDYPDLDVDKVKRMMREYLASVRGVDRNLGRVLETLDALNLSNNTIVIFSADHGYNMGHNGIWHKGNGIWATKTLPPATKNIASKYRPNLYDHSLRVPVLVRWPGVIKPGAIVDKTVTSLDWYPTIAAMAGATMPSDQIIRGRNFLPLLKGQPVDDWDNDLYAEYSMMCYCRADMRAWRTERWKLVRDFLDPERDEFYDLKNDPEEFSNLIHAKSKNIQDAIAVLHQKIMVQMEKINDPLLKTIEK